MRYLFLRFKTNIKKFILFFLLALGLASFAFYANENYLNSDRSKVAVVDLDASELSSKFIENLRETENLRVFTRDDLALAKTDLEIKKVDFIAVILDGLEENIAKDLYEDSIDIYYREADTKTDIVKDIISIELVKLWVDEEFSALDTSFSEVELREYIELVVRNEKGVISDEGELQVVVLFVLLFLVALAQVVLVRDSFKEKSLGIKARLASFGIRTIYYVDALVYKVIVIEILSLGVLLADYFISATFIGFSGILQFKVYAYLYAIFLEIMGILLGRFIKKESSFTLVFEIVVLLSFVGMVIIV